MLKLKKNKKISFNFMGWRKKGGVRVELSDTLVRAMAIAIAYIDRVQLKNHLVKIFQ